MLHENTSNEEAPPPASPANESLADHGRTSHSACFRDVCCADADSKANAKKEDIYDCSSRATTTDKYLQPLIVFELYLNNSHDLPV
jgi:hypothetical protein